MWQFVQQNHDVLATLAALASTIAALVGLSFTGAAMWRQAAALDATAYLDTMDRLANAQRKVRAASNSADGEFEANELLNLLEGMAQLYLHRRFGRTTRRMVRDMLGEALAFVHDSPEAQALFLRAMTSRTTFAALKKFERRHRRAIQALRLPAPRHERVGNSCEETKTNSLAKP